MWFFATTCAFICLLLGFHLPLPALNSLTISSFFPPCFHYFSLCRTFLPATIASFFGVDLPVHSLVVGLPTMPLLHTFPNSNCSRAIPRSRHFPRSSSPSVYFGWFGLPPLHCLPSGSHFIFILLSFSSFFLSLYEHPASATLGGSLSLLCISGIFAFC